MTARNRQHRNLEGAGQERRLHTRYPLAIEISYSVVDGARMGETGASKTIDLSSSALRFIAAKRLDVGTRLEVAFNWPIPLAGAIPLQLVCTGSVIRTSGKETVVSISHPAFKTRRRGAKVAPIR